MTVRSIELRPLPGSREPAGTIVWDDERGEIVGDDPLSERIRRTIALAEQTGHVRVHPYPCSVAIIDPLRDARELAAILGWYYFLPDWLMASYPKEPPNDDGDEDSDVPYADVIH